MVMVMMEMMVMVMVDMTLKTMRLYSALFMWMLKGAVQYFMYVGLYQTVCGCKSQPCSAQSCEGTSNKTTDAPFPHNVNVKLIQH